MRKLLPYVLIILAVVCALSLLLIFSNTNNRNINNIVETQVVTESAFEGQSYPNRYIDWQAEVVCYYLGKTAISCLPLSETLIKPLR